MNCSMSTFMPQPTARNAVPRAAVVLPLPGPVLMRTRPLRESVIRAVHSSELADPRGVAGNARRTEETVDSVQRAVAGDPQSGMWFCRRHSVSHVVGVAGENRGGSIDLFCYDEARQGVSQRHGAKGKKTASAPGFGSGRLRPAIGRANGKDDVLRSFLPAPAQPYGQVL